LLVVLLLTFTALHGAVAENAAPAPQVPAAAPAPLPLQAQTETLLRAIFGMPEAPAVTGIEAAGMPAPEFKVNTVPCCRPAPCGCYKTATAEACEGAGGTVYGTLQACAASCCW
jgi:hypothetical protein